MDRLSEDQNRLELAMAGTRLGLWDWNMESGKTVFNQRWAEIIGYSLAELEPTTIETWMQFAHPEDLDQSGAAIEAHVAGEADYYDVKARMRHRDGHWVWVHDRGRVVERADDGTPLRMVGTHEDITDRVAHETQLQTASVVFDNSLEGIVVMGPDLTVTSVNPAFTTLTGWQADEVVGGAARALDAASHDEVEAEAEAERMLSALRSGEGYRAERRVACSDGTTLDVQLSMNPICSTDGTITGYVAQLSDIRERVSAERERLDTLMFYDQATGLPNRHLFLDQLDVELKVLRRSHRNSALLLLNLDRFKQVNEAFGYGSGELVMAIIADRLQSQLRAGDLLARHAGDEFAILLASIRTRAEVDAVAAHLLATLDEVLRIPGAEDIFVTACIGALLLPGEVTSAEQAIQRATAALHTAKARGPGSVQHHVVGLQMESRERLVRATQIRQAWSDREFRLDYQPIFHVSTGELSGAEALMRWSSPLLGDIPPSQFIPLAEDVGLITEMGTWAIEEVCRQGAEWARQGLEDINISVNVTAQQLVPGTFVGVLEHALRSSGFAPERLILELTESTLLHAGGDTIELLARVGRMGVRVALDDFGTGYSSFAYLRQYPLDKIKIDRSFITGIDANPRARSIVAAMIDMGHHLGLQVLAEGVEEQSQLDLLCELGCDLYQGFLRSRAITADALLEQALAV